MSKSNKIFNSIPVDIPGRSGFDLSHEVLSSAMTGAVVPLTHFELCPGDSVSMGSLLKVTMPPFAVPFMGRIDAELTAAFIPYRLLWKNWQSFITANSGVNKDKYTALFRYDAGTHSMIPNVVSGNNSPSGPSTGISLQQFNIPVSVPLVDVNPADPSNDYLSEDASERLMGPGSLADYLGVHTGMTVSDRQEIINSGLSNLYKFEVSALPFLAYHKFCDDWIIDENNMKPFFPKPVYNFYNDVENEGGETPDLIRLLPYFEPNPGSTIYSLGRVGQRESEVDNGYPYDTALQLGQLRQRCWPKDYFTTATTRPQAGADSSVYFDIPMVEQEYSSGSFTIAQLRAANSLQKWLERNGIAGTDYGSQILAHFGVTPPDATLNRSVLLGSVRTPVYVGSVENNTGTGGSSGTSSPYGNVLGAAAGFGSGASDGSLIDNFTAHEHGIIMVFFTLIPHSYYNGGIERQMTHKYLGDFAWPEFANIGDQPIYTYELTHGEKLQDVNPTDPNSIFGYQQRYVEYKHMLDKVTGLVQDGESLQAFALQRGFLGNPALGRNFLTIPTAFLDQVAGVSSAVSQFSCMIDAYFDCRVVRTLPEYSLPHL